MSFALHMLGIWAETALVRASTDSVNCEDLQSRYQDGVHQWLVFDFDNSEARAWNSFEGCCKAAGSYYALWPKLQSLTAHGMLVALAGAPQHATQWWVSTVDDHAPGENEPWTVETVHAYQKFPWDRLL